MPIVLNQKLHESGYDDDVGSRYHFPYLWDKEIQSGETFVYYHPREEGDHRRYYFGMGRVGDLQEDPLRPDHRYAEILDYLPFDPVIPFRDSDGAYLEGRPDIVQPAFQRSARRIGEKTLERILEKSGLDPKTRQDFVVPENLDDLDQILANLNEKFKDLEPRAFDRLVSQVDRPTSVSRALKKKLGHTCQICGVEGFRTMSGSRYAEAHHLRQLHKLVPGSLATQNVLIVCATCHRKLHHASVDIGVPSEAVLEIAIDGETFTVERNVF